MARYFNLIFILSTSLAISAVSFWVMTFYFGLPANEILSASAFDRPSLLTNNFDFEPILGIHYFGDFQEPLSWSKLWIQDGTSPYALGSIYPPISILIYLPFALIPNILDAWIIFTLMSFSLIVLALWRVLGDFRITYKLTFLSLALFLTAPFISLLDRGNNTALSTACIAFAYMSYRKNQYNLSAILLAVAISLKGLPLLLLVVPIALSNWKYIWRTLSTSAALILTGLLVMPGGLMENAQLWISNLTFALQAAPESANNFSVSHLMWMGTNSISNLEIKSDLWTLIVGLVWLSSVYIVVRLRVVPISLALILAFASMTVIPGFSFTYSLTWVSLAAAIYVSSAFSFHQIRQDSPNFTLPEKENLFGAPILVFFAATLAPLPFTLSLFGQNTRYSVLLSSILLIYLMVIALLVSLTGYSTFTWTSKFRWQRKKYLSNVQSYRKSVFIVSLMLLVSGILAIGYYLTPATAFLSTSDLQSRSTNGLSRALPSFSNEYIVALSLEQRMASRPGSVQFHFAGSCEPMTLAMTLNTMTITSITNGSARDELGAVRGVFNKGFTLQTDQSKLTFIDDLGVAIRFDLPRATMCLDPNSLWIENDFRSLNVVVNSEQRQRSILYLGLGLIVVGVFILTSRVLRQSSMDRFSRSFEISGSNQ